MKKRGREICLFFNGEKMKKIMEYIKTRGFTDRLYFLNLAFAWGYTLLCLILSVLGRVIGIDDYSFVSVVCPLVWGELGVHTACVVWKAKSENMDKYKCKENITM